MKKVERRKAKKIKGVKRSDGVKEQVYKDR